jgi:hypothetical protein
MTNMKNATVVVMLLLASLAPLGCGDDTVDPSNPDASAAHDGSVDASKPKDGGAHDGASLDSTADSPRPDGEADGATGGE